MRQEGGFSPTTQSAMDWALEELLQGPEESMMIKHDDRATDYIDQLHEMLNKHHPTSEGLWTAYLELKSLLFTSLSNTYQIHNL